MEHHEGRRVPLGVLYGLLLLLFVWAVAYIVPMTRDMVDIAFRPATVVANPFLADWPDGIVQFAARDLDQRSVPPLQRGDRIVSIDGRPFHAGWELSRRVAGAGTRGTLHVVVARKPPSGIEEEIASTIALRSVAEGEGALAFRALIGVVGLLMPWVCVLVGFWVAFVRPRDPVAWLVLFTLLGFQVAAWQQPWFDKWPDLLRVPAAAYRAAFDGAWPLFFPLFGVYFAGRLDWERRHGWVKWVLFGPVAAYAAGAFVAAFAESLDLRGLVPAVRVLEAAQPIAQLFGMAAISFFFLVVGWKMGVAASADGRRRLMLLSWGACVALLPALGLIVARWALGRPWETSPVGVIVSCLIVMPVFPLTLAYVILVDRAMDVRVAVRQGLRYAVTRGAIRVVVLLFMAGVLWNAWNLVNDPTANRPQKLQAIAWGMAAALLVPRFAKRAFDWTDRRFFREAYDVERVLTELSEQVRAIAETGPLLDTVLDRIGTTLHVDRLAVFLH
jgi:sigma-B regulation protein RsbU (phosphoserine phosphatase)